MGGSPSKSNTLNSEQESKIKDCELKGVLRFVTLIKLQKHYKTSFNDLAKW
ncbi:MAG: hypothetical protein ACI9IL_000351 [Rickettsiales bacterium]|jgi:hypothetical protein